MEEDKNIDSGAVLDLSYSKLCESSYYLATGCQNGQGMILRGDTGEGIGTFDGHNACIWSVSLNADATRLVTGSDDKTVRIWNAIDGTLLKKYRQERPVSCVAIDSKSRHFLTGNFEADPTISLYDMVVPNKKPIIEFKSHTRGVRNVTFCHNDSSFVSSSYDRSILLWDCRSGKQSSSIILPHHAKSLELCDDGQTLTICYGESVVFLNVDRFEVLAHHKMPLKIVCASLHPQKKAFVCCGSDRCVYKYDYLSGLLLENFHAHNSNIRTIKYSPDGEMYASCANKGDIAIWPKETLMNSSTDDYEWDGFHNRGYQLMARGINEEDNNNEIENNEDDNNEQENEDSFDRNFVFSDEDTFGPGFVILDEDLFGSPLYLSDEDSSEQFDMEGCDDDENEEEEIDEEEIEEEEADDEDFDEEMDDEEINYFEEHNEEEDDDTFIWNSTTFPSIEEATDEEYNEQFGIEDVYDEDVDDEEMNYFEEHNEEEDDDTFTWNSTTEESFFSFDDIPYGDYNEQYGLEDVRGEDIPEIDELD